MAAGAVTIYALCDPATKEYRYVGKTNDLPSRIRCHRWEAQSSLFHTHKVNWLRSLSGEPIVEILQEANLGNWQDAERYWINKMREQGANLTNFANGGQTSPVEGKGHTEETKNKLRVLALERGSKPPSRKGCIPWNKGTKGLVKSNKTTFKKGHPAWNKGKKMSIEFCEKNRLAHIGIPLSPARWGAQAKRNNLLEVII